MQILLSSLYMRSTFFLVLFIMVNSLVAQMCPCEFGKSGKIRKRELGISLISSVGEPGNYRISNLAIIPQILNGLNYKYHFDKWSFRAQAAYKYYKVSESRQINGFPLEETTNGNAAFFELRSGLEKTLINRKIRLYIGLDALFGTGKARGTLHHFNTTQNSYNANIAYYGFSVVPGLSYRMSEKWSLNLEPCINLTSNSQNSDFGNNHYFRAYCLLNTLSLNFHF